MAIIVNSRESIKPLIFTALISLNKQREIFLDDLTSPMSKCGVKRDGYWVIDVRKTLESKNQTRARIAPSFGKFLIAADKQLFSFIMIKSI